MDVSAQHQTVEYDLHALTVALANINQYLKDARVLGAKQDSFCDDCGQEDDYTYIIEDTIYKPHQKGIHFLCAICLDSAYGKPLL